MVFIKEKKEIRVSLLTTFFTISLILFFISKIYCFQSLCTSLPDLKPCKCHQNSIVCSDFRGDFDLENISKIVDSMKYNYSFAEFRLYNTSVTKIGNVFKSTAFELISISDNQNLSQISETAFSGSAHTLPIVSIEKNRILSDLSPNDSNLFNLISKFKEIHYILMSENNISSLPTQLFDSNTHNFSEFSYLNVFQNNIQRIESKTFIDLLSLKDINLGKNQIHFINDSAFEFSANITSAELFLTSNELNHNSFAQNWFSLKSLDKSAKIDIDLSDNNIVYLDQRVFEDLLNPQYNIVLTLRYNPIKCDCRSRWLVKAKDIYKSKVRWMTCEDKMDIWLKTDKDFANCTSK